MKLLSISIIFTFLSLAIKAQIPSGTNFLNKESMLGNYQDKNWYKDNIPFLEVPDANIQQIYYYRWYMYYTNLRYTIPSTGFMVTEFSSDVWWATRFNGIVCAAGHHIYEGRWLRNQRYMNDLAVYWGTGVGAPRSRDYTFWKADSYYARYMVNGDKDWIKKWYQPLVDNYNAWNRNFNPTLGLYWREGVWDGMELSATSLQAPHEGPGYRPTINSYLYADARAISKIATMLGNTSAATDFENRAQSLKTNLHEKLWDNSANFFKHKFRDEVKGDMPYPGNKYYPKEAFVDAREQHAYTPWYMNMVEDNTKYIVAWDFLFDAQNGFYSNYGPTTLEKSHRLYRYQDQNCCHWNGMSWPFSTAQTILAMANVLHNYQNKGIINKDRYFDILKKYTMTHYKDGIPYIAEAHDPDIPFWSYDLGYRSQHYNHSSYNDLIITGLLGLRPRADDILEVNPQIPDSWNYFLLEDIPYHGHLITILYDKNGSKYNRGVGLKIYLNGAEIYSQPGLGKALIPIETADLSHNYGFAKMENYACNPDKEGFPSPSASFVSTYDNIWEITDGRIRFDENPKSRATTYGSTNAQHWYAIGFGQTRNINRVDLLFYQDTRAVRVPASYSLQYWDGGNWKDIPQQSRVSPNPIPDRNTIRFPQISTTQIRANMQVQPGFCVGLTEFETWQEIPGNKLGNGNGLTGTYFNGMNFEEAKLSRIDAAIDYNWGSGSPDPLINIDRNSIRWEGQIQPLFSENYTFHIRSDNGRRLWIDNVLVIDKWINDYDIDYTGQIQLEAGRKYDIKIEYFEDFGGANIRFQWESPSQMLEVVPKSQLYAKEVITRLDEPGNQDFFSMYPNPSEGVLWIESGKPIEKVSILDVSGKVLQETEFDSSLSAKLELNAFEEGIYFIKVSSETSNTVQKLIIQW